MLAFVLSTTLLHAQGESDSIMTAMGKEVIILGTRPGERTPITKQMIKVEKIQKSTTAWDLPTMLMGLPSIVVSNDGGIAGGYSSFSIRGVDPTRVNITVNGVPMNDSESQLVFWANMPDFGSRLDDIVIVRGAGASSFGAGAFGATMDMRTARPSIKAGGKVSTYWGSYGMNKNNILLESGRLAGGWRLQGAFSTTRSNGYVDRSGGKGLSYLGQLFYEGSNYHFQLIHNGGDQKTGIAWNGLSKEEEEKYGRRYNSAGVMNPGAASEDLKYYHNSDNYKQSHSYAIWKHFPSDRFQYAVTLHYTRGKGFTEEYRTGRKLKEYGLKSNIPGEKKTALIREKYLDNHFYGGNFNLLYKFDQTRIQAGGSLNHYIGAHFGLLPFVESKGVDYTPNQEYYRNNSKRLDGAFYLKGEWDITRELMLYADLMYRHVGADMHGLTDKWDDAKDDRYVLDYNLKYNFLLPKAGINYRPTRGMDLYLSYSAAGKEPSRNNFTESRIHDSSGNLILPRPEYLHDFELGGNYTGRTFDLFINGYYMHYKDQLVPNGSMSDVGEAILVNAPKSYRLGVEFGAAWRILPQLEVGMNGTISRNRLLDFEVKELNYDTWAVDTRILDETPIAMSPSFLFNHHIGWSPCTSFSIRLDGQYVGKRYLDNFGEEDRTIPGYYVGSLMVNYRPSRMVAFQAQINNLWNTTYSTNGYSAEPYTEGGVRKSYTGFYPAAPIHFIAGVTVNF